MDRKPPSLEAAADVPARRARPEDLLIEPPPPAPKDEPVPRRRARWGRRLLLVLVLLLLGLTILPVLLLRVVPAYTSSFMLRYQFERLGSDKPLPSLRHDWVAWEDIAPAAKLAVIAAEDQRFDEHFGFDLEAIEKAVEHNKRSRRTRGASTISQQLAKNLFLWPQRSWARKGLEVGYTLLIEAAWPKRRVLEVYLNVAEFGTGVYGVEAAAQRYFGKPAARLTYHEAALLAAVLPNPRRYRVDAPSGYVQGRAEWIRGQMNRLGTQELDAL